MRVIDRQYTVENANDETVTFPELIPKSIPHVRLTEAFFLLEGSFSEYEFEVTLIDTELDFFASILLVFPLYYSTSIANEVEFLLCKVNGIEIPCTYQNDLPFTLVIKEFPYFIDVNTKFYLTIFGILAPSY